MIVFFSNWKNFSNSQKDWMKNLDFRPTLKADEMAHGFTEEKDKICQNGIQCAWGQAWIWNVDESTESHNKTHLA